MVKWVLATALAVATTSHFVSAEDHSHSQLSVIAGKALEERALARGLDAINVEVAPLDVRVSLPKCGKAVTVLNDNSQPSLGRVTVGLRCQTPEPWTIYLRGHVTASTAIPVLKHPANRSELISEDDVVIRNIQIESDLRGIIIERGQLVGKVAVRDLIAGQPLRQSDVKAPTVISRGQSVTIKAIEGGLSVTMKGKALGNARVGDRIWVQNERSKKRVEGIVSSSGDVLVQ
ncbi:MAG: flagellar basal body P-ring formation protein FlgA [Proteobacteria bacterium]|nr:flagellar basal body P-ring formation protein FlgA [Pseudomonadota bacterium]